MLRQKEGHFEFELNVLNESKNELVYKLKGIQRVKVDNYFGPYRKWEALEVYDKDGKLLVKLTVLASINELLARLRCNDTIENAETCFTTPEFEEAIKELA